MASQHQNNDGDGKGKGIASASSSSSSGDSTSRSLDLNLSLGFPNHAHAPQSSPNTHPQGRRMSQQYYGGGGSQQSPSHPAPSAFGFFDQQPNYTNNNPSYHYHTSTGGYIYSPAVNGSSNVIDNNAGMGNWLTPAARAAPNRRHSMHHLPSPPAAVADNFNMLMQQQQQGAGGPVNPVGSHVFAAERAPQMYQYNPNGYIGNNSDNYGAAPVLQLAPPSAGVNVMSGYHQYQPPQVAVAAGEGGSNGGAAGGGATPRRRREGNHFPPGKKCLVCRGCDTPMWRRGPHGPKTLCNACGIKYRKEEERTRARQAGNGAGAGGRPNNGGN
ncbi:unnamed protein product [Linum trigynum]|uniref:GATA-type domain-containing protein n=1 Tax=Linum trigynum TaxID=586398 RepID=A0AAV2DI53_9ROSI